jgi:hypothetical protein
MVKQRSGEDEAWDGSPFASMVRSTRPEHQPDPWKASGATDRRDFSIVRPKRSRPLKILLEWE